MTTLLAQVTEALDRHQVAVGAAVAVGCSGGADSTALADLAMTLGQQGRLGRVTLVYVDHGLRPDTAADRGWVGALAEQGGAGFEVVEVEVDRDHASLEAAARAARYRAFEEVAAILAVDWVLLAHTASDQAETVLMRVLRGSGVVGLAAIPARRGRYLRPLLRVGRAEILEFLGQRGLRFVHDPTNDSDDFLRNRIRHRLLPELAAENPEVEASLCRIARAAGEQRKILDFAAEQLISIAARPMAMEGSCAGIEGPPVGLEPAARKTTMVLDIATLHRAPASVIKRGLALAVEQCGGEPLEARHQRILLDLVRRVTTGTVALDLPRLRAVREYGTLRLQPPDLPATTAPGVEVSGPHPPYLVRCWQPGDRMRPARLQGRSRKLSDLYTDAKIPRRQRVDAVVVVRQSDGVIVWAEFVGAALGSQVEVTLTPPQSMARNSDN